MLSIMLSIITLHPPPPPPLPAHHEPLYKEFQNYNEIGKFNTRNIF